MDNGEFIQELKTSGKNISYWLDSVKTIKYSSLFEDVQADVVIVGGGIAGITIAYSLALKGMDVVVVEDGYICSGETGRTTAHLTAALDNRYYEIEKIHGETGAKLAAESHNAAIDFIEEVIRSEKIDCDFERVSGYLFLHPSDKKESLEEEFTASQKAGMHVEMMDSVPGIPTIKGKSIQYFNQAQFHIMKYMSGLCKALERLNVRVFTETNAQKIDHEGIETDKGYAVKAKHVVIATNTPINDMFVIHTKQSANRTYAIGTRIKKGSISKALWWDTGDQEQREMPYHYARIQELDETHDLLITGGEDHMVGNTSGKHVPEEKRFAALEKWTHAHFPPGDIIYHWSGQVMEPYDGLAFIGRNPLDKDNVYIVTGDSGNGLTHGTIAGILIPDLILKKENPWEKLYDPGRVKISTAGEFVRNALSVMGEYLKDIPGKEDMEEFSKIKNGEGKVVVMKGEKVGAFRDNDGELHIVSAVCTHLQCIVHWNNEEKSWDCPCHGSRFTVEGKVINGPANTELPYYQVPADINNQLKTKV